MSSSRSGWGTSLAAWTPTLLGLGLWAAVAVHLATDDEGFVTDAVEMFLPFVTGIGLVGAGAWRRRRSERRHDRTFAYWLLGGVVFGVAINQWFFLVISLESTLAVEPLVMFVNGVSAAVIFTVLIGHYYVHMQETVDELRETNERLEDFASVVSHDLRNPLNIVQGHLALARETGEERHFDAMARATERMEQLIREVLALSRTGDADVRFEPVDLGSVARKAAATVDAGSIRVVVEDDLTVTANAERLRSLLENLVRNAAEHGGPAVTTVRVGALADGSGFYVEDDGRGIPPADRERVFEGGYSTSERGTGFGLSIVRRVAEVHDWAHAATESETGGARFEFSGVERP